MKIFFNGISGDDMHDDIDNDNNDNTDENDENDNTNDVVMAGKAISKTTAGENNNEDYDANGYYLL
jgi:hypothetical protein